MRDAMGQARPILKEETMTYIESYTEVHEVVPPAPETLFPHTQECWFHLIDDAAQNWADSDAGSTHTHLDAPLDVITSWVALWQEGDYYCDCRDNAEPLVLVVAASALPGRSSLTVYAGGLPTVVNVIPETVPRVVTERCEIAALLDQTRSSWGWA